MPWPRQAFRLSAELLESVSREEVESTIADMRKLKILHAPFEQMDIIVPEHAINNRFTKKGHVWPRGLEPEAIFRYDGTKTDSLIQILVKIDRHYVDVVEWLLGEKDPDKHLRYQLGVHVIGIELLDILIVLLATKNIVKETKECKMMRLGIGKKTDRHQYTTSLSIGRVTETQVGRARPQTGEVLDEMSLSRRPHLRRGHIRNQSYGPSHSFHREIWIEPIFVNADPAWIEERTAYNVSIKR